MRDHGACNYGKCRASAAAVLVGLCLALGASPVAAQAPLLEYRFNEGAGTQALNSGSLAGGATPGHLTLIGLNDQPSTALWALNSGVTGRQGDHAFSLLSATGMGASTTSTPNDGPYGDAGDMDVIGRMRSFTLSGWFRLPDTGVIPGNQARLVGDSAGSTGFSLSILSSPDGPRFGLRVDGMSATSAVLSPAFLSPNRWIFFAATYDATVTANNVARFYTADAQTNVAAWGAMSLNAGPTELNDASFRVGNGGANGSTTATNQPFQGLMDNVRLHGAASGTGGVLDEAQLEAVRRFDLAFTDPRAIPEPGSGALVVLPAVAVLGARRRRRRENL